MYEQIFGNRRRSSRTRESDPELCAGRSNCRPDCQRSPRWQGVDVLRSVGALRQLVSARPLWLGLESARRRLWLAPLYGRALGLQRSWLDMVFRPRMGVDALPLWPMGLPNNDRLVLGA